MSTLCYYVRFRGTITGPYAEDEIIKLHEEGSLSRYHQISPDEITWTSLAKSKLLEKPEEIPTIKVTQGKPKTSLNVQEPIEVKKTTISVTKPVPAQPTAPIVVAPQNVVPSTPVPSGYQEIPYPYHTNPTVVQAPPMRTSGMAITSFILSLFALSILAVIFGHVAISQIDRQPDRLTGSGFATAGLVIGYITLACQVIYVLAIISSASY